MTLELVSGLPPRVQRLKISYAAWARGDEAPLVGLMADDVAFTLLGDPVLNPHCGQWTGIDAFRRAFRLFHSEFVVNEFLIEKILCQDDDAAVHWHANLTFRPTGRVIEGERCDIIAFRDDLVARITCFFDSASMAVGTGRVHMGLVANRPMRLGD